MAITEFIPQDQNQSQIQNPSQAPIIGEQSGTFGAQAQQRRNINQQGGSGRFTNLQQYVQANEANNPNAQLLQREAQARQGELGTKQTQFVTQATPIKTGLEAIRTGQQFVQSALQDPTQYLTPERLGQFAGYRTSGVGDIETPYNQFQNLRSGLGTQQEQLASGLETIKSTPTALQNYIQSQRVNPSLATRGENVLDRFLTQSTQSGQQAITGLGTTAGAIRQAQAPSIAGDIETLRTQAQAGPVSSADVRNLITAQTTPEEEYIRNLNNLYVAQKVGLGSETSPDTINYNSQSNVLSTPLMDYVEPENLGTATQSSIDEAKKQYDAYNNFLNRRQELESQIAQGEKNQQSFDWNVANANYDVGFAIENAEKSRTNKNTLEKLKNERSQLLRQSNNLDVSKVPVYQQYLNQLGKTKQELLSQYDPTRLSRIQALQQLAGTTQFNPLLQTRLA
jgi:hypothetical protein